MANIDKGQDQRVVFMTTKAQRDWLDAQSKTNGAPLGEIIRRAIQAAMDAQKRKR